MHSETTRHLQTKGAIKLVPTNYAAYAHNQRRGVPRQGAALLQGIVYCGRCGHKMAVQYKPTVSPLIIPLLYCHINGFQRAFSEEKPLPGGEKRMAGWAAHPVEW